MTDITKCSNKDCPLKNTCFRFLAKDGYWQSYSDFKPKEDGTCEHYWKCKTKKETKLLNKINDF
jgi:hypothetical protein